RRCLRCYYNRRAARPAPPIHRGGGNGLTLLRRGHRCQRGRSPRTPPPEQRAEPRRLAADAVRK
ncbi:MAG TPA: hypothetical protein VI488_19895, partial [Candidatus Angelobacter sp.]